MGCKLFISHATADVDKVTPIVDCITSCFEISNEEIMYTSSLTKGIRNGKDFNKELRDAIQESALVIVFLSANYLKSQYCLIELGATWGNNKKHFIIKENKDISFHELSIFSTTTQDILSDETIGKLHRVLKDELILKQKLTDFLAILEQCKKATNKIFPSLSCNLKQSSRILEEKNDLNTSDIPVDGLKLFKEHHATYTERLKQARDSVRYIYQINGGYSCGIKAFSIIEAQYKNIRHFLRQYATTKEDIKYLKNQSIGRFGDFYSAFRALIANIDYLNQWYQTHQNFRNNYEFCISEYSISNEVIAQNIIEESDAEKLAAVLYIIRHKCSKISAFDKRQCSNFLIDRENIIISKVLTGDISKGIELLLTEQF